MIINTRNEREDNAQHGSDPVIVVSFDHHLKRTQKILGTLPEAQLLASYNDTEAFSFITESHKDTHISASV